MGAEQARQPVGFSRRVLLVVTGMSPQVLTETVYALVKREDPWVPTEVHLVSTADGADRAVKTLLGDEARWFGRLCEDLGTEDIHFDENSIHVVGSLDNKLEDIRTPGDNNMAADFITELVSGFTMDERSALHVSIAGGRKTMGYYAGYALSLYGRPQDRLSHVLVSKDYEGLPDFYYPGCTPRLIYSRSEKPLHTTDAVVDLAEIPFVRLRADLPGELLAGKCSFGEAVQAAQFSDEEPHITVNVANGVVECGGKRVDLSPVDLAYYAWLAERCSAGIRGVERSQPGEAESKEFLSWYAVVLGDKKGNQYDLAEKALRTDEEATYFQERSSRVNGKLKNELGQRRAVPYMVGAGRKGKTRYALGLDPESINFEGATREGWSNEPTALSNNTKMEEQL